jgi:hypothetical protein
MLLAADLRRRIVVTATPLDGDLHNTGRHGMRG